MSDRQTLYRTRILPYGLLIYLLFLAGFLFPEKLWALNFTAFAGFLPGALLLIAALTALLLPAFGGAPGAPKLSLSGSSRYVLITGIALTAGLLFHALPVQTAIYGDGPFIAERLSRELTEWDPGFGQNLFSFNLLDSKIGYKTFYGYTEAMAWWLNMSAMEWLRITQALAGALFTGAWLLLIDRLFSRTDAKVALSAAGLSAPIMVMFMGLPEMYAMPYMATLGSLCVGILALRSRRRRYFALLFLCVLLSIKLHISGWFLMPIALLGAVYRFMPSARPHFTWRNVLLYLIIPGTLAAMFLYFSSVGGLSGQRTFTDKTVNEVTFLPVFASEGPPFDRYGLFSPAHLLDYLNVILLWSPALCSLLLICLGPFRKQIDWNRPELLLTGLGLITYLGIFFIVNPLMSMPFDWDLFSLPAPLLWVFTALAASQLPGKKVFPGLASLLLGLSLLGFSGILHHQSAPAMGERIHVLGRHAYKTYWFSVSRIFSESIRLMDDAQRAAEYFDASIEKLEPHAVKGLDVEYGAVLLMRARLELNESSNDFAALPYLQKGHEYAPYYNENNFQLVVSLFRLKKVKEAEKVLPYLLQYPYPSREKCLKMAVHISLEAENFPAAKAYTRDYLSIAPNDPFFRALSDSLQHSAHPESLKGLFLQPK